MSLFMALLREQGIPLPEREFTFAPPRRWRFDYAWAAAKVAVEVEGGIWTSGRHVRGKGYEGDLAKYNQATLLGWRVIRFTPQQLMQPDTFTTIRRLLNLAPRTAA